MHTKIYIYLFTYIHIHQHIYRNIHTYHRSIIKEKVNTYTLHDDISKKAYINICILYILTEMYIYIYKHVNKCKVQKYTYMKS